MRLFRLELKRILKSRRTLILLAIALLLSVAMAYLPISFEGINRPNEDGTVTELDGLAAIVAIYAEDSRETTLENILAAMPYMDEDMRQLAAAAVNKLQAMTDSEFSEREFILTDEE